MLELNNGLTDFNRAAKKPHEHHTDGKEQQEHDPLLTKDCSQWYMQACGAVFTTESSGLSLDKKLHLGAQRCRSLRHDPGQQGVEVHKHVLQHTNGLQAAVGRQQQDS